MPPRHDLELLSAADAFNVHLDATDQVNVFSWVGLLGPGGFVSADGTPDMRRLRAAVAGPLRDDPAGTRRLSQRLVRAGRRWAWQDCAPDLDWHVRLVAPVSGSGGLAGLCAELVTTPLARSRPLWEMLIVPGAGPHGPGLVVRVHHAVADGVAGVRLIQHLFPEALAADPVPPHRPPPPALPWWRGVARTVARVPELASMLVPRTPLLGPIGPRRAVVFCDVDLLALRQGARAAGATVNDALLAAVGGAVAAALRHRGAPVPGVLPASVPVSLQARRATGNAVGLMIVHLPTGEPDLRARLARISRATRAAKEAARASGTFEVARTRWGTRLFMTLARRQRLVALFVTNVRGPLERFGIAGAPLERAWAVTPLHGNVRLTVAAFSCAGRLACAVHADAEALDADLLGEVLLTDLQRIAAYADPDMRKAGPHR